MKATTAAGVKRAPRPRRIVVVLAAAAAIGAAAPRLASAAPADAAPVIVDLSAVPPRDAARLAAAVPEWEEAIAAGSDRITVTRAEAARLRALGFAVTVAAAAPARPSAWPSCYDTLDEVYAWADAIAELRPDLVALTAIGESHCKRSGGCRLPDGTRLPGRDLLVLRIARSDGEATAQGRLWLDGGLHAREIPGTALMQAFVRHLVDGYGHDAQITYLLDHREVYVGLNSNPDGRALVEIGARAANGGQPWQWRKNGHIERDCAWPPTPAEHFGVDLNRNHLFKWSAGGSTTNPCGETYRGRRAASESETQAFEAFVRSIFPDRRGPGDDAPAAPDATGVLLNFHNATTPGTILSPWGWTDEPPPDDAALMAIAARYAAFNGYARQRALYEVSGNTRDWGYGELGVPSYVIELEGADFFTPCSELPAVIADQLDALVAVAGLTDRPYERIAGPEVTAIDAPAAAAVGETVDVVARLDDARAGGAPVTAAEVTVASVGGAVDGAGHPAPRGEPGSGLPMHPLDGVFDWPLEDAAVTLDTTGMAPGRHYVVVRGRDAAGLWGPARAVFLVLTPAPTVTASPSPTVTASPAPTVTASSSPTPAPTSTASATASPRATATGTPSAEDASRRRAWLPWATT